MLRPFRIKRGLAHCLLVGVLACNLAAQASDPPRRRPGVDLAGVQGGVRAGSDSASDGVLTVLVGRVVDPDGMPATGATVVTSAGGQAVTNAAGDFRLEVEVPAEAAIVRVTAVMGAGTGSLVGSASVGELQRFGTTAAGTLMLEQGASCDPSWLPTFGEQPGVGGEGPWAMTTFDDGSGPALYVAGNFTTAGSTTAISIAKWDGSKWSALSDGFDSYVNALAVFDDGQGPALYVGGSDVFDIGGGRLARYIAKWDGTTWSTVGAGMNSAVFALTIFDDGQGPELYAGGAFTVAGGVPANYIAKWNGTTWQPVGSGMDKDVGVFEVWDDGGGPALYVGGSFKKAGGAPAMHVATWDGAGWSALGSGTDDDVYDLTILDDGSGSALYAGGAFTEAGGVTVNYIAKWDGTLWSALGSGVNGVVSAVTTWDDGNGPALYAGGYLQWTAGGEQPVVKWDGTTWSNLDSGLNSYVYVLSTWDDGSGPALCAGGTFTEAGDVAASHVATWDGAGWTALGSGMNGQVNVLTSFDDGHGPQLHAGGNFTTAGGVPADHVARWDGGNWSALGGGFEGGTYTSTSVDALAVFDDGSGPALYAGGNFTFAGGVSANYIAKWGGSHWLPLGSGMDDHGFSACVCALAVFDDGSGSALYAGGDFATAGGVETNNIARWDGTTWSALGGGASSDVVALAVFDDGGGPALYAGGSFKSIDGVSASSIARWDGASWSPLGGGIGSYSSITTVGVLTVFDDGSGPALHAGGYFTLAGGSPANYIAKWDGTGWSPLGSGMSSSPYGVGVSALTVFDDGSGPALYAGGAFDTVDGMAANNIEKWDGTTWSALGSGIWPENAQVFALTVFDDGSGPALFAGGTFAASDSGDSYLAKWGCSSATSPWSDLGQALAGLSGEPVLEGTGSLFPDTAADILLTSANPGAVAFFVVAPTAANLPFKGGTLVPSPTAVVPMFVDVTGQIALAFRVPAGLSSGSTFFMQYWIPDAGGPQGLSASNGLMATLP